MYGRQPICVLCMVSLTMCGSWQVFSLEPPGGLGVLIKTPPLSRIESQYTPTSPG
ncbi:uncharacterized protein BO95DRAFT_440786 [Aspergillus brunneoviolaceus CBS 621.78]|uniref:Uncharacterized protein n=1 Tax=Aspergillus brunneoviolaceus CBS 621.78 TaxID=1450534 RepID=A0ACD1GFJ5_9EURO|nr:hypothetical protein BO95DRAFT_440786 [Aspergillus brunneoviolaceus CBS 621.78]RAH48090.1 hypothetical protein BO95DRAFT_440786 [Aspergillus brunneoviolaceus CBS 621.78]